MARGVGVSGRAVNVSGRSQTIGVPDAIPDSGVSRWKFEGDLTDSWGDNAGTKSDDPQFTTDNQVGTKALSFDGNDRVDVADDSTLDFGATSFSWGCWVKPRTYDNNDGIMTKASSFSNSNTNYTTALVTSSNGIRVVIGDGSSNIKVSETGLSTSTWYHFVGVYDHSAGELTAYRDGPPTVGTASWSSTPNTNSGDLEFADYASSEAADCIIDDPRIYDKALSSTEVSNWYSSGSI